MPFLHFINFLRLSYPIQKIIAEIQAGYGNVTEKTLRHWRGIYQGALGKSLDRLGARMIGGDPRDVVVIDETVIGVHDHEQRSAATPTISKGGKKAKRSRPWVSTKKLTRKGILKKLPARTFYPKTQRVQRDSPTLLKKPAAKAQMRKKPASSARMAKRPAANLKNAGRWLWLAVLVGNGNQSYTHENGSKRVAYRLMPAAPDAKSQKPRGLLEIKDTIAAKVRARTMLVYDGWKPTDKAVRQLGYNHAPPVRHEAGYRDTITGFHTNDVESENKRLKFWSRSRYGRLVIEAAELDEYVFYINIGDTMTAVMKGLAHANPRVATNVVL